MRGVPTMTVDELASRFQTTRRTINTYVAQGILPPPTGHGRWATYGPEHVAALKAYRELIPERGNRFTAACFVEAREAGTLPERLRELKALRLRPVAP